MEFPNLFSPIRVNNLDLKNRVVMTAAHLGYAGPDGSVTDRLVSFYTERARGGVGLIVVGGCPVDDHVSMSRMIRADNDRYIGPLQKLTETVKKEGARIAAQIYQAGRYIHSSNIGGRQAFSASAVFSQLTGEIPRALESEEVRIVQDRFVQAAVRTKKAGFDAVEVHGGSGYLVSQFLSPLTNQRTDIYGGSAENRMRFGIELVQKIREAVGPDYPILMRISGNEFMDGGNTLADVELFAQALEKAGCDLLNVTVGWHESRVPQLTTFVPRGCFVYAAKAIKSSVSLPIVACNRINDPTLAEHIIQAGSADMVAMTRALIADPDLLRKAFEGEKDRIYHCVACNQGCFDNIFKNQPVACLVNPRVGVEAEWKVEPAAKKRKVLVVGGGPGGMKAACIAAERGHRVVLAEKGDRLGGQLLLNRNIPGREEMATVVDDLINNLNVLGVDVLLNEEVDEGFVRKLAPQVAILATGAQPILPAIKGIPCERAVQALDVLRGKAKVGQRVVIVGGNAVGLETALFLASVKCISPEILRFLVVSRAESWGRLETLLGRNGKEITVVEMNIRAGKDIGASTRWTMMAELERLGVEILTQTRAVDVTGSGLKVERDGKIENMPVDSIVIAVGSTPENTLYKLLQGLVPEIHIIGDAKEVRNAFDAIKEGFLVASEV